MQLVFPVTEVSHIAAVRRSAAELSAHVGLDETQAGGVAIAVTEAATNILKHGGGGQITVRRLAVPRAGVELVAFDRGPGIPDMVQSLRDGFSTVGTAGNGLGAMRRLASEFALYSGGAVPGVVLRMAFYAMSGARVPTGFQLGVVCAPMDGESVSGDAWGDGQGVELGRFMVADGLGHGPNAARASQAAVEIFDRERWERTPDQLLEAMHLGLKSTRGAAVAVAELDLARRTVRSAGVGNISVCVVGAPGTRHMVSHNGIVGHNVRKIQSFSAPWDQDMVLVMHSDGLSTHWDLNRYPGLVNAHAGLIAAVLYRDFSRNRDDTSVLVVKAAPIS